MTGMIAIRAIDITQIKGVTNFAFLNHTEWTDRGQTMAEYLSIAIKTRQRIDAMRVASEIRI